ncbi:hypothetical protein QZH41_015530, partial [Actinostola sp. cb2023]
MERNQDHSSCYPSDEAETFEIALGKSNYMDDDCLLMEEERRSCHWDQEKKSERENEQTNDDENESDQENSGGRETDPRRCCPKINTTLLVYKSFYFFFLAAIGALIPFLAVFYKQLWLSAKQTGVLLGIGPLIKMVAIPMWGVIVDVYKKSKFIFIMSLVAWLVAFYSISLVSPGFHQSQCHDNSSVSLAEAIIDDFTSLHTSSQTDSPPRAHFGSASKGRTNTTKRNVLMETQSGDETSRTNAQTFLRRLRQTLRKHKHHHITKSELVSEMLSIMESRVNSSAASNRITEISKAFNREKMERVFDFLNMQGHYPWPLDTVVDFKKTRESDEWGNDRNTYIFTVLFVITAIGTLFSSPTLTLADIATLQKLGDNKQNYGKQRLWGACGYGVGAFAVGACISTIQELKGCNNPLNVNYMPCFYTFVILMGIAVLIGGLFDFDDEPHEDQSFLQGLGTMFCNFENIYFIVTILFCGCATGVIETFLFWHLEDIG